MTSRTPVSLLEGTRLETAAVEPRPFARIRCLVRVLSFSMVVLPSKIFSFQVASRLLECPGPGGDRRRDGGRFPDGGQSMGHLFVRLGCDSQRMKRF